MTIAGFVERTLLGHVEVPYMILGLYLSFKSLKYYRRRAEGAFATLDLWKLESYSGSGKRWFKGFLLWLAIAPVVILVLAPELRRVLSR